ncbi:MAG TPA: WYL domain-containing protein [Chroococcales cyanobacterium]
MSIEDKFSLELTQEEGILLLTSARLLDKLVAGVTIHARERDELIREIIDKLSLAVSPQLASMSDELAEAIVESVLGCDEQDDEDLAVLECDRDFVEVTPEGANFNYPMYAVDKTLPLLEKALINHERVQAEYYSFAKESVDKLTLDPLTIIREEGMWRMVAYCREVDDVMVFRVDRIKDLNKTGQRFETPSNFNQKRQASFAAYC